MKRNLFFLFLSGLLLFSGSAFSQVGVNTENPYKLTELHIKNIVNGTDTIPKGIMIPRMTEAQREAMDVNEVDDVNSLMIYNIDEDCYNYYSKLENEWQSLCGKLGKAQFTMDCSSIKVYGQYLNKESLGTNHYIKITVEVTKAGSYSVTATSDPDNGYYFSTSGEFLTTGTFDLYLQGAGTPKDFTPNGEDGDLFNFYLNGIESGCTTNIKVEDSSIKPNYTMNCSTVKVNGVYVIDKPLDPSTNTITLTLNVQPDAAGSYYIIKTDEVDGISFSGSGILGAGPTQTVTLQGTGTPTSVETKKMTISSNSALSVSTCTAYVTVAYTRKTVIGIGSGDRNYGYGIGYWSGAYASMTNIYGLGGRKMMMAPANFGTGDDSTVKIEGYDFIDGGTDPSASTLQSLITANKPDMIVIGYSYAPSNDAIDVLIKYMGDKGVVIAAIESSDGIRRLFERTLNLPSGTVSVSGRGGRGTIKKFNYVVDSELLNGPFGDIRELTWGEDASTTQGVSGVPTGMVDVLSNGNYNAVTDGANIITICKFKGMNMVFIGDGGFWSRGLSSAAVNTDMGICPLYYDSNFRPIAGLYGEPSTFNQNVYNSFFFANMIAWAVKTAEFDGYNTPR